ncbi:ribonuclease domain-containing protein [Nocardia brasiliensis]|uniref:Guanyl-specific ribonuclease n=1 Tax=Nocardia brasiliensis (strain ATCC 700358 / HUJEG-1) TaxID=1133849 RepID=K0ETL9_NOCB7|nr:ribonuclease domain-containing protein [Nocardia brasiliensis]AFT99020.1 guanyl-specific ribonuclease [Nocardia brasiliensis ATCC 700358]OCF87191.1 ribonuclease [Nocardia brasiliensis]
MNLSPKAIRAAVALGAVALVLIVAAVLATRGGDDRAAGATTTRATPSAGAPAGNAQRTPEAPPSASRAPGVPDRAYATLREIDAGRWPDSANAPGTKGGDRWMNRGGDLPATDASGTPITYQEWDVNPKQRNRNRDAERIVTGSDGAAWYTGDHYKTFTRMR